MSTIDQPPKPTRKWFIIGLGVVMAWMAFMVTQGPRLRGLSTAPPELEDTALVAPAEYHWRLEDLDGAPVEFSRFRGRPILLNLWATWCPPCVEEFPSLARLASDPRIKAKDVAVVCVSTDESPEAVRRFAKGKGWGMTILRATAIPPVFMGNGGLPMSFLIAPDGVVAASVEGPAKWDDPSVIAFLEKLAKPAP